MFSVRIPPELRPLIAAMTACALAMTVWLLTLTALTLANLLG